MLIGNEEKCKKSSIQLSEKPLKDFITLIRLNKPVYQPGDTVKFLILALDYDTKPYMFNEIQVEFFNSRNKKIKTFSETSNDFKFNSSFEIPYEAKFGEWKLHVYIKKAQRSIVTKKSFHIQNVKEENLAEVFIEVPSKVSINHREVTLNVFAKNSTYGYASGNANVTARFLMQSIDFDYMTEGKTKMIRLSGQSKNVTFNFKEDLNINALLNDHKIVFDVVFTDDLTQNDYNKSRKIDLTTGGMYEIRHNENRFLPGVEHKFTVKVFTLDGKLIDEQAMKVSMKLKYSNSNVQYLLDGILHKGEVTFTLQPPENARDFIIDLIAGESIKRVKIEAIVEEDFFEAKLVTKL